MAYTLKKDYESAVKALDAAGGNKREAARLLGINESTLRSRLKAKTCVVKTTTNFEAVPEFSVPEMPPGDWTYDELKSQRLDLFTRKQAAEKARKWVPIQMKSDAPMALVFMGDPHVDDDGCNWPLLEQHTQIICRTPGMYAGNLGDTQNNWVGRLIRLYAKQSTSHAQAWTLVEGWIKELSDNLLFLVRGNHDCHDAETEALTKRGWLRHDEIRDDDEVLSYVTETGGCEWAPILSRVTREHDGELLDIKTQSVSLSVTPNHRVLCKDRDWKRDWRDWKYVTADSLPARVALPVSGAVGNAGVTLTDDEIALAGWVLTDGCIYRRSGYAQVTLYQSKDGTEIDRLLSALGLGHSRVVRQRNTASICGRALVAPPLPSVEWRLTAEASRKVISFLPEKGRLPAWAHELSAAQFAVLLDAIVAGDGTWDGADPETKRVAAVHGTEQFLSSLQAVAVQHGWYARLSVARGKDYRLNLCRRDTIQFETKPATARRAYSGKVWCLTVPRGNFMVRRDGAAHFSGNCWSGSSDPLNWIMRSVPALDQSWQAKFQLVFPNDDVVRIWVAHDFPGHSQYNDLHGLKKAHLWQQSGAHIFGAGHRHIWGLQLFEDTERDHIVSLVRARGYKFIDHFGEELGHASQQYGASMTAVIVPGAPQDRKITWFLDVEEAADYLTFKRRRQK